MREAITDWRTDKFLQLYPHARLIKGHREVRPEPTECPGPIIQKMIDRNSLLLKEDENMPLNADDKAWLIDQLDKTVTRIWSAEVVKAPTQEPDPAGNPTWQPRNALREILNALGK
jgi:hypothetical protein